MTYRLTTAPKHASLRVFTCAFCGHDELGAPVFLAGPHGTIAAGSGCAAVALYGERTSATTRKVRNAADALAAAEVAAERERTERRAAYAEALATLEADGHSANLQTARRTYATLRPALTFPQFLAHIATTGDLNI